MSGETTLILRTVDDVVVVDGEALGKDRHPFRLSKTSFARKQHIDILKAAEEHEQGK